MTEPAAAPLASQAPRKPFAVAFGAMIAACGLILVALILLAQGAVAADTAPGSAEIVSRQSAQGAQLAADPVVVTGAFTLGDSDTTEEAALSARIATSSVGGGFITGAEIQVAFFEAGAFEAGRIESAGRTER